MLGTPLQIVIKWVYVQVMLDDPLQKRFIFFYLKLRMGSCSGYACASRADLGYFNE